MCLVMWAVLLAALAALAAPAAAFGQGGGPGELAGHPLLLSNFEDMDNEPAVAYNGGANQYLVVWSHQGDIYGRGYDAEGTPISDTFAISRDTTNALRPAAAYALSADSYLVVWDDWRGVDYDIYGQRIDADFQLLGDNLLIYTGPDDQMHADLAFDGSRYLVVWDGPRFNSSVDACGRFVEADGDLAGDVLLLGEAGDEPRSWPAVAYNATQGEYLAVFEYGSGGEGEVHARRVAAAGTLPGAEFTIADEQLAGLPDVAGAAWGAYVVVWSDARPSISGYGVYGQVVLAGADNSFDGGPFALHSGLVRQPYPAVAMLPATGHMLVVWEDDAASAVSGIDLYGQRLLPDANLAGPPLAIATTPGDQVLPAIAGGQGPDAYLAAWQEGEQQATDIHGQIVAGSGSLWGAELSISARPDNQVHAVVAHNPATGEYLAVWDNDFGQIIGRRVSADGRPLEEPQVIEAQGAINDLPAVAVACDFWMVAWRDWDQNRLEYAPLYPQGGVITRIAGAAGGDAPTLAADPGTCRFLQAWEQGGELYAGLGPNGPIDVGPLALATGSHSQGDPAAAFDPDRGRYLVVWEDTTAEQTQIRGRTVARDGTLGAEWTIAGQDDPISRFDPAVTYNSDDGEFLVAYQWTGGPTQIRARRVEADGTLSGEFLVPAQTDPDWNQSQPAALYAPEARRYYIAWTDGRASAAGRGSDIYGRWLEADGTPVSPDLPAAAYPLSQVQPAVAYDPANRQGALVWMEHSASEWYDVYFRLGALDTTPPTARFTRDPTSGPVGTTFVLDAGASRDDLTPPGALAVRWDWTGDGTWDTAWSLEKVATLPPPAAGTYDVTLQVRDLMRNAAAVSQAIAVLSTVNTPPQAALAVAPAAGAAGGNWVLSAAASADAETPAADLEARWDWENDGAWDTPWATAKMRTHSYTATGLTLARVEVRDGGGLTDAAVRPLLVLPGPLASLQIAPGEATLGPGGTVQFRATATDTYGNVLQNPDVVWWMADPQAGTIDDEGLFTAGSRPGAYPDAVAARLGAGAVEDRAAVTIGAPGRGGVYLPIVLRESQ